MNISYFPEYFLLTERASHEIERFIESIFINVLLVYLEREQNFQTSPFDLCFHYSGVKAYMSRLLDIAHVCYNILTYLYSTIYKCIV